MRALSILGFAFLFACSSVQAGSSDGDVAQSDGELERALAANATLRGAVKAIDSGHPWRATLAVTPMLESAQPNRAALLIAARAAAAWDGWSEVEKLLGHQTWLDSSFNGEGHELLARAALAANSPDAAVQHATAAIRLANDPTTKAVRQVYLARALDRGDKPDNAGAMYATAAKQLPQVADWLALRAAGADRDADARARAYATIRSAVATARVPWTEAQSRERFGDLAGAAQRFAALGARVSTLRLRLAMTSDADARARIKDSMVAVLRGQPNRDDARQIVQILDASSLALVPRDELAIGRALSAVGPLSRAVTGYDRADRAGILQPADRLQYGLVLARSNRMKEALAQLDSIQQPASIAGHAAYQRARLSATPSNAAAAIPALRSVADRFAADADVGAPALYLLADLSTDEGADDSAIAVYRELYRKYPTSSLADDARFRAAILDFAHGRARPAAIAFDSLVTGFPNSNERVSARYWSGRAWQAAGDANKATASWQAVLAEQPASYYAQASARRLNRPEWTPPSAPEKFVAVPSVDSAFARITMLQRLGMDAEVRFELEAIEDHAMSAKEIALATANAFRSHAEVPRGIRIANKLIEQGDRDARAYRLAFPLVDREELERQATAQHLDPALVAGLIKQESSFDTHALSPASARGLMQVLPSVGAEISRALRFPVWSPSLLYDADANLQIGTAHLASATKQYGDMTRILAAYNAGNGRVDRWSKKTGTSDSELFMEQIPFAETRDYVRVVQRNRDMYRMLYGLK